MNCKDVDKYMFLVIHYISALALRPLALRPYVTSCFRALALRPCVTPCSRAEEMVSEVVLDIIRLTLLFTHWLHAISSFI